MIALLGLAGGAWLTLCGLCWLAERSNWANRVGEWMAGKR